MQRFPKYLLILIMIILSMSACTTRQSTLDVTKTDLAGVKLYMTKDQAVTALKKFYQQENLNLYESTPYNECSMLDYSFDSTDEYSTQTVGITLLPQYAHDRSKCVVVGVEYRVFHTKHAVKNVLKIASLKYSAPTIPGTEKSFWCMTPTEQGCVNQPTIYFYSSSEDSGLISLYDPRPWLEKKKFEQKDTINKLKEFKPDF